MQAGGAAPGGASCSPAERQCLQQRRRRNAAPASYRPPSIIFHHAAVWVPIKELPRAWTLHAVFESCRLDRLRRYTRDKPRLGDTLEIIKFVCKDFWQALFKKQVDNLKTNHRVRGRASAWTRANQRGGGGGGTSTRKRRALQPMKKAARPAHTYMPASIEA